jgi:cytochrome c biogenesis protein CcdA
MYTLMSGAVGVIIDACASTALALGAATYALGAAAMLVKAAATAGKAMRELEPMPSATSAVSIAPAVTCKA